MKYKLSMMKRSGQRVPPYRFVGECELKNIKWYAKNPQFYYTLLGILLEHSTSDEGMSFTKLVLLMFWLSKCPPMLGKDFEGCHLWEVRDHVFHALLTLNAYPNEEEKEINMYIPYPEEFYKMWK
jgi:hypothetical protein